MKIEIAEPGRMTQTGSSLLKLIQNNHMPVLDLLVRESIQNSLDARKEYAKYVEVDYKNGYFNSCQLAKEFEGITDALRCRFPEDRYEYIAVRDTNTVGLTGEMDYKKIKDNNYGNLLKLIYEICKPQEVEGAGGSWGLGKTVYFRIGIGLVIYYSRIMNEQGNYESRLAASYVEDETSSNSMIPVYNGQARRGIAWWGESIGENITQPVTDEQYIDSFLKIFGITKYENDQTGTTIIIPYIDKEKLLTNNQTEYINGNGQAVTPYWCNTIEDYLTIAVQRWYAPRLNNIHYTHGAYLRTRINDTGIASDSMEPAFKVIQALYNRANCVTEDDILTNADVVVKRESITVLKYLSDKSVGIVSYAKVSRELLGMNAPQNKPDPCMYFNCEIRDKDSNRPVICYTRKPAMIVSYEDVGAWTTNILSTVKDEYIIGIFVLKSWNQMKNSPTPRSLEEYVRRSEMADHTSWSDWSEDKYNPRIVSKIQTGVNRIISKEFAQAENSNKPKANSGLGKLFGDMLLPPDGFGKKAGSGIKPGKEEKLLKRSGFSFKVDDEHIRYMSDKMLIPVIIQTSLKKKISKTGFYMVIDSESKKIEFSEWENKMDLKEPFFITESKIQIDTIDGEKLNMSTYMQNEIEETQLSDIKFVKMKTKKGTCFGIHILSDVPHSIQLKIMITVQLNRNDVRPVFAFEKEETNG